MNADNLNRNNSIDIFRLLCSILVVVIHTDPLADINSGISFLFTQIFSRIAVPFFFTVSGFYYINSIMAEKQVFLKYCKKLLAVYTFWSIIYFIINFLNAVDGHNFYPLSFIKQCVYKYFIIGSSYHFWFFPALFFCVLITTIAYKSKMLKPLAIISCVFYIIGCLGCSYYAIGNKIPLISDLINTSYFKIIRRILFMGMPLFLIGYFLNIAKDKYCKMNNKKILIGIIGVYALFLLEIVFVIALKLQTNLIITIFLYPLLAFITVFLINNPLSDKKNWGARSRVIANFMYYSHPFFIITIGIAYKIIFKSPISETPSFLLTIASTSFIGLLISFTKNKWINKMVI